MTRRKKRTLTELRQHPQNARHARTVFRFWLLALLLLALLLRLYSLGRESFWFDESYSVAFATRPLHELSLFHLAGLPFSDRNFYHLLLHFWLPIAQSDVMLRLPSALAGWGSVLFLYALGTTLFDRTVGLWSAALLAISPLHIWYSQEARMYIFTALFSVASVLWFARVLRADRTVADWIGVSLAAGFALYTHFVAILVVVFQNAFVLYRAARRQIERGWFWRWVVVQAGVALFALPLLIGLLYQQRHGWWGWVARKYGPPRLTEIVVVMQHFSVGTTFPGTRPWRIAVLTVFAAILLSGLGPTLTRLARRRWRANRDDSVVFVWLYLALPMALAYAISQITPLFITRYLVFVLPAYCLALGLGLASIPNRWLRWGLALAIVALSAVSLHTLYRVQQKEDWRGAAAYVDNHVQPADVIFLVDEDIFIPFHHYFRHATDEQRVWRGLDDPQALDALVEAAIIQHDRLWIVRSHAPGRALDQAIERNARTALVTRRAFLGIEASLFRIRGGDR